MTTNNDQLTQGLIAYFEANIPIRDISNADEVIEKAKEGGQALHDYLDTDMGLSWNDMSGDQPDEIQDCLFLLRAMWRVAHPLVDWDAVAKRVAELKIQDEEEGE